MKNLILKNRLTLPVLGFLLVAFLASFTFTYENGPNSGWLFYPLNNSQPTTDNQLNMKFDYDKAWKEIEDLEKKGLPKSALEKVNELLENARSESEHAHFIKALIYKGKYESQLEEDGLANAIFKMQGEIEQAQFPVKPILQSMLAEMYANYLAQNRWQFQNRTQTVDFKNEDIRTWSMEQLLATSAKYYWASLEDDRSKTTDIQAFKLLLLDGENDEGLRPTLYDFLAHRAIDHFSNEQNYLSEPAYKFEIDQPTAFAQNSDFVNWKFETKDSTSHKYQTLLLFQDLLRFRLLEKRLQSPALLDVDLKRLSFVFNNSIHPDKDELYIAALEGLKKQYEGSVGEAEINFALAQQFYRDGSQYQVPAFGQEDLDDRKWLLKNAHDLCQQTVKDFPNSVGASNCYSLLSQILRKDMSLETEMVNLPAQPYLSKLTYQNLKKVYLKTIRFTQSKRDEFEKLRNERDWQQKSIEFLNKCEAVKKWSVDLPDEGDFHQHAIELKMDKLPLGQYAIVVSENENFQGGDGAVGYLFTHISNLGYWERRGDGEGTEFVVFNRNSGQPIKDATVEFWVQSYNSVFRKYEKKKKGTKQTNADGFVKADFTDREDRNFSIRIKYADDELVTDQNFYNNFYRNEARPYQQTQFFLDRGIYRPGQTVFFKGIALNFDNKRMPTIIKNEKVTVTFRDANYQETATLDLRTNEYGTFSGQFTTPRGGLLGNMQIVSSIGGNAKSFRVEEYKRPKFEVTFEPITESFRLNDKVNVVGKATAYAGNQIDGAQVTWRVVRETRFPWYWWGWGRMPWMGETMEIAHGTSTTDENGLFNIDFTAIPDNKIAAKTKPEFSYTIYADVTDITGETQSNQTEVKVGYIAMQLDVPVPNQVNVDSLKKLQLVTKNLNGEFEPAQGTIKIDLLKAPEQIYIERYWGATDKRSMTEAAFKKDFPQFAWTNENQPENWLTAKTVLNETFDTEKSKEVILPKTKWQPGWYAITVNSKDKYGEKVELKKFINLFDLNAKQLSSPALVWHFLESKNYEPGTAATSYFGTSRKQQPVLLEYEKTARCWNVNG
ncbi:MAG: MG2 domain-containing protein [Saprospiraceae bacterium]